MCNMSKLSYAVANLNYRVERVASSKATYAFFLIIDSEDNIIVLFRGTNSRRNRPTDFTYFHIKIRPLFPMSITKRHTAIGGDFGTGANRVLSSRKQRKGKDSTLYCSNVRERRETRYGHNSPIT